MPSMSKFRVVDKSKGPGGKWFYLIEEMNENSDYIKKIYIVAEERHRFWETKKTEEASG